jgi:alpha-N-arabinofuranosidase
VHSLAERPGWLRLKGQASGPGSRKTVAWVGRRVLHEHWTVRSRVDMPPPLGGARAGLCVIQNDENHLRLELAASSDGPEVRLVTRIRGEEWVVGRRRVGAGPLSLDLWCEGHTYSGLWSADGQVWEAVAAAVDGTFLTTESAGGFVGCMVGPFAVEANADFDWVDLRGYDE